MSKTVPIRILLGLVLAISFSTSAHADTYPTVTFAYPIIDENIVDALTDGDNDFQSISVTQYQYDVGTDTPISDSAVENRGYHVFYVSQNQPSELLNLNNDNITIQNQIIYFKIDDSNKNYEGYLASPYWDIEPHLNKDLTAIQSTDGNLAISPILSVGTLQSWIDLVDSYLADGSTRFSRNNVEYLDFHRQIGYVDDPNFLSPSTVYSHVTDSYFRVYRTGSFFVDGPTEEEIAAEAARVAAEAARVAAEAARVAADAAAQSAADAAYALKMAPKTDFGQCYLGSDKVADPTGEIRGMLDEINRKYGNLIKF
jgi:hypothetical protein